MTRYAACGKQVKRGSEHVADAADETWAQIITDALNGERCPTADVTRMLAERYGSDRVDIDAVREYRGGVWKGVKTRLFGEDGQECIIPVRIDPTMPSDTIKMQGADQTVWSRPAHTWQRQQEEYACSCGARWDVSDGDEHPPTR